MRRADPSDLVVCYDVLQYLDDREAARAIANFKRLTRAALYVSALTREDWREHCDRTLTDRAVHLRAGDWYRRRLARDFRYLGFGVWLRKDVHRDFVGHGEALTGQSVAWIQSTSAAWTGSPAPSSMRASLMNETRMYVFPDAAVT